MHGGKQEEFEAILREYYGAQTITYLEPLPGPTVKHLDMFFKVVDGETFFVASYDAPFEGAGEYCRYLNDEIGRVLRRNEQTLRARFPDRKIVRVPMPAVVFPSRAEVVREYRDLWYTQKLLEDTPALRDHLARAADANERIELKRKITARAVEQYRIEFDAEPGSEAEEALVDQLIREHSITNLNEAVRNYVPKRVVYKTYLNSVHLPESDGGGAVLVPRYGPDTRSSAKGIKQTERAVREAYEAAIPASRLSGSTATP